MLTIFPSLLCSGCYGVDPASVTKEWKCARCKANAMTEVSDAPYWSTGWTLLPSTIHAYWLHNNTMKCDRLPSLLV